MSLVEELTQDHRRMQQTVEQLAQAGIASERADELLRIWRQELVAHLRKEDERLYPALQRRAASDEKVRWTLDFFAKDLGQVSGEVQSFFARLDRGEDRAVLAREYGKLVARLKERIRKEENQLFPEYQRVAGPVAAQKAS